MKAKVDCPYTDRSVARKADVRGEYRIPFLTFPCIALQTLFSMSHAIAIAFCWGFVLLLSSPYWHRCFRVVTTPAKFSLKILSEIGVVVLASLRIASCCFLTTIFTCLRCSLRLDFPKSARSVSMLLARTGVLPCWTSISLRHSAFRNELDAALRCMHGSHVASPVHATDLITRVYTTVGSSNVPDTTCAVYQSDAWVSVCFMRSIAAHLPSCVCLGS